MCRDCSVPLAPSRRSFATFLAVGAGLTVLTACNPGSPAGSVQTPESSTSAVASGSPAAAPSGSPEPVATAAVEPVSGTPATAQPSPSAALPGQHSLTDPASPWLVVNKYRPLQPADYAPADLVQPAVAMATSGESALLNSTTAAAAEAMFAAAAADGVFLTLASGYRSYNTQVATYNNYVAARGQADADTASARPGYSEHQTGWAFDIADGGGACSFQPCFADQPAGVWAAANGHRFGFVVRYQWMFHPVTGYYYEPWHLRYIGVEAATDMVNKGIHTLEEYFGTGAAPGYP
ncbi:D-alanyl-D-alanine carboxypeptidase family protein [Pseudarthrobacter sp. J75]|uniref:M15 family metallopeptidase n=1 Tax=unclassified Pseudarthrobacter TaxID=2647000 RepID=UPI002E81807E|nr:MULTISPECIES: D-alanyl-D-alanine carboxypeptidase family protein [unclassified Pseudarthrobacter]MEE2521198.1 D-alanyl-D-alanine carboxypeptidase family protein [Pseudarthrobacter sp. J47]MEE2528428.1 D-alanyl-D-alanine carboxypeptidase family protein [Pseudarthrobacter sp. J75]